MACNGSGSEVGCGRTIIPLSIGSCYIVLHPVHATVISEPFVIQPDGTVVINT